MPKKSNPEVLAAYQKKSGDAYKKSPIYKADVSKTPKGRTDYSKRRSTNIIDAQDKPPRPGMNPVRTKVFKYENAKGTLDDKVMHGTSVTDNVPLGKKGLDANTRNRNITINVIRNRNGLLPGFLLKDRKLGAPPTTFVKSKKKKKK